MSRRPHHSAFTIIEMLAASVLAAVLMLGVLSVLAVTARDAARMRRAGDPTAGADGLVELIRADLSSALVMSQQKDGKRLVFIGYGGIDPATLRPSGRAVQIEYAMTQDGTTCWLFRRQKAMDESSPKKSWVTVVAGNITSLRIEALAPPTTGPSSTAPTQDRSRTPPELEVAADPNEATKPPSFESVPGCVLLRMTRLDGVTIETARLVIR